MTLGTEGVRLPSPMDGSPGMLKLELAKSEADDILLSEEMVHPSLWPTLPRGVEVMGGASRSTTSPREPVGLRNMLEQIGRVVSTVPESIMLRTLHLFSVDSVVGEGKQPCFLELQASGDFTGRSRVDS